jgi:drug/metabolite transporter (DMT)-like permease
MGQVNRDPAAAPPQPTLADRPLTLLAVFQVILLTAGWGGNAPALRYSLQYLPPYGSAALRFLLGLLVVVVIARWQRVPLGIERHHWKPLGWLSTLFAVQIVLLNHGSMLTAASRQALLINSYPLFVPLFAHFLLKSDRVTWNKALGTAFAFGGILFVFGERFQNGAGTLVGDALVVASAVLLAARVVYTGALVQGMHPYALLFWQSLIALPAFVLMSVLTEPLHYRWNFPIAVSILYQGIVVAGLCFVGWTAMLQKYPPSRLSVGFFLTPVFGALASYAVLHEPITAGLAVGGGIILLGLVISNLSTARIRAALQGAE